MGNSQPQSQKFNSRYWRKIESSQPEIEEYQNTNDNSIHIEKHHIQTPSQEEFQKIKQFSYLRKNNPRWISALYFDYEQTSSFCNPTYIATLYLQKITLRLSECSSIPFPEMLHLYDQTLHGFWQLSQLIGCFKVEPQFIGINERGVVKVWGGPHWPHISVKGGNLSQQEMVKSIFDCLRQYSNSKSMPSHNSIPAFIYRNRSEQTGMNFDQAINEFKNYVRIFNESKIPTSVNNAFINRRENQLQRKQQQLVQQYFPPVSNIPLIKQRQIDYDHNPSIRKVNSFSHFQNIPVNKHQPFSRNNENRQINTQIPLYSTNKPVFSVQTLNKSLSNPNIPTIRSNFIMPNQPISFTRNAPQHLNQSIASNTSNFNKSQVNNNRLFDSTQANNLQSKKFTIKRQSQLVIYPPSQSEIPLSNIESTRHGNLHISSTISAMKTPLIPKDTKNEIKNAQQSQSIIIQLYKQRDPVYNSFQQRPTSEAFKYQSQVLPEKRYDASILLGNSSKFEHKYQTPIGGIKKQLSNLNSIEQVQTEHYWKDNSVESSPPKQKYNYQPYSLNNIKQTYQPSSTNTKQLVFTNKYNLVDDNDGKSSPQFIRQLKQMESTSNPFKRYNQPAQGYNQFKTDYEGSYQNYNSNREPVNNMFNYKNYDSYGSVDSLNDKYDSKYTTSNAIQTYNPTTIDPDIWADIKAAKY